MNIRENTLAAWKFQKPEWIPVTVWIPSQSWLEYDPTELDDIMATHPLLFPDHVRGSVDPSKITFDPFVTANQPFIDDWGAEWLTTSNGMVGVVTGHPLSDWSAFENYKAPDPKVSSGHGPVDWTLVRKEREATRARGQIFWSGLHHGHTFLKLTELRGFENVIYDMADDEPRLWKLLEMIETFNRGIMENVLALDPDIFTIPEDLGMQTGPMLSPEQFHKYIRPSYERLTAPAKARGLVVHEHSDGYIMDLLDDLLAVGGTVLNLQDRVNGLENIAKHIKGRIAIDLDIDRQHVTATGTPREIDDWIRECVMKLKSPNGGLSLMYHAWYPTPIQNIRTVCDAFENYCRL